MKQTAIKYIMLVLNKLRLIFLLLILIFGLLTQMEKRNGTIHLKNPNQHKHLFGHLIISLVLEEQEMIC